MTIDGPSINRSRICMENSRGRNGCVLIKYTDVKYNITYTYAMYALPYVSGGGGDKHSSDHLLIFIYWINVLSMSLFANNMSREFWIPRVFSTSKTGRDQFYH